LIVLINRRINDFIEPKIINPPTANKIGIHHFSWMPTVIKVVKIPKKLTQVTICNTMKNTLLAPLKFAA
jgi:hypothetical protein